MNKEFFTIKHLNKDGMVMFEDNISFDSFRKTKNGTVINVEQVQTKNYSILANDVIDSFEIFIKDTLIYSTKTWRYIYKGEDIAIIYNANKLEFKFDLNDIFGGSFESLIKNKTHYIDLSRIQYLEECYDKIKYIN